MPPLPKITAKEMMAVLKKLGFSLSRQRGSHHIFKNNHGRRVTVPFHAGKILHPKVVKDILSDADISVQKLIDFL